MSNVFVRQTIMACSKTTVLCVIFLALYVNFCQVEAWNECYSDVGCRSVFRPFCCDRKFPEDNKCAKNCLSESCNFDSDCAPGECCDSNDKCRSTCKVSSSSSSSSSSYLAGWIIAVIVISVIVVIAIPVAIVVFCCCCAAAAGAASRRPAHGGVIVAQPATAGSAAVFTTQNQQHYPPPGQPMYPPQPYPDQPPAYHPQAYPAQAYPPMSQQTETKQ